MLATEPAAFFSQPLVSAALAIALVTVGVLLLLPLRRARRRRLRKPEGGQEGRLGIVTSFELGKRRRVLLIRRDDTGHFVLTGGPSDTFLGTISTDEAHAQFEESSEVWTQDGVPDAASSGLARPFIEAAKRLTTAAEGLVPLALLSGAAGAGAGLICGLFRMALEEADRFRNALPAWLPEPLLGFSLLTAGASTAAALSAFLVRRYGVHAAGSGIPQVEAVISGDLPTAPYILLPVKFVGGLLAIGAGFALGREGPCVQMGATFAHLIGKAARRNAGDCRVLLAAGAGAGLAAAFNAPLAGSAFVLEELLRKFDARSVVAALGASGSAIVAAQFITGSAPIFAVAALPEPTFADNLLCSLLGITAGLAGAIYNRALFGALAIADRLAGWTVEARAAAIGAAVGALAWFAPGLVGGGDALAQQALDGTAALALLPFIFVLRLILSAASYAAGTPGGLFAPLLALGAQMGFLFGSAFDLAQAAPAPHAASFALVGMAALFAAVVRAPLTGMILVTEMTANSILLLPMLAACFSAMAVAAILGESPVYDALKIRTLEMWRKSQRRVRAKPG
jgi:chloride channel protein, CIC family